jgi:hypothetical protein
MAIRFHRSLKLLPGVRLNLGKRGIGISAGVRGFRVGVDSRGKAYTSAGIPGTGLSVRKYAQQSDPRGAQRIQGAFVIGILIGIGLIVVLAIVAMATQ